MANTPNGNPFHDLLSAGCTASPDANAMICAMFLKQWREQRQGQSSRADKHKATGTKVRLLPSSISRAFPAPRYFATKLTIMSFIAILSFRRNYATIQRGSRVIRHNHGTLPALP